MPQYGHIFNIIIYVTYMWWCEHNVIIHLCLIIYKYRSSTSCRHGCRSGFELQAHELIFVIYVLACVQLCVWIIVCACVCVCCNNYLKVSKFRGMGMHDIWVVVGRYLRYLRILSNLHIGKQKHCFHDVSVICALWWQIVVDDVVVIYSWCTLSNVYLLFILLCVYVFFAQGGLGFAFCFLQVFLHLALLQ